MPVGKVKWYDSDKGFGFVSREDGDDVFLRADALPAGVTTLKPGTRVEFGIAAGRRGDQALQVRVLDPTPSVAKQQAKARRKPPEDMVVIVEDTIRLLDQLEGTFRAGRFPEGRTSKQTAALLRALADELSS
ncbi:cold shock domain-containing protein [Mumia sp. zg.B53]|uniref:cold shock domain-containing protein n=1 Tax=unclassified Mumia TaxID=2621872 RepID=UPI001C6DF5B1|nr:MULTISPECIES: cold shock domain-containing protein [unclassified Mumia]MBW9207002.1 cold shock domain-containing protein [Mumia sp. zg.B17]MBW9210662.1 cold shock domain-containing protein [Mumia sp. zg.B21]MBW9215275.1 cold shock domain-containing protein [Mumia sp. zg.B53]MDD9350287.1 cold shock domain-containing protein [Mumia sp.]